MDTKHLIRTPGQVDELFPWLREDLIRGIPHFISPAWTADRSHFDPEYWADCWARMGFQSVELLTGHHDGFLLYPSQYVTQQPERDYFGEQVEACRRRGIRVMAYYSLTLDSLVGSENPQWRVRDMAGRIHQPDYGAFSHYHWLCLNSPYRDLAVGQLEEVVTRYDVDGVWIDILYLPGHTELLERDTCFCDDCHRQYSVWFHGEHLLDAAGTPRHDEFRALTYRAFLAQLKQMLMGCDRPLALTFNGAGRRRVRGYKICDDLADFFSGEAHNPISLSVTAKSHGNAGRAFELLSCSEVCWSHNQLKPDTLIKLESLATIIAGGTYTMGITNAPDGRLSEANVNRLVQWGRWIGERAELFRPAEPVYEAGILAPELGPGGIDRWATWLRKGHFLFNVFMDLDQGHGLDSQGRPIPGGLDRHRLIIVPAVRSLSAAEAEALEEWTARGGTLLLEYPAAALREHAPWMEKLAGVRLLGEPQAYAFYLQPDDGVLAADLPPGDPVMLYAKSALRLALCGGQAVGQVVQQFRDKVRTSDVQTVANYWAREDELERWPGLVENRIGKGRVLTTALPLTVDNRDEARCPWPAMLAQNCVRYLLGEQMVSVGAYSRVEVNLCRQPGRLMLHFVNHGYDGGEYIHGRGEVEFLHNLPVQLAPALRERTATVRLQPEGDPLEMTPEGFILPRLGVYQGVSLHETEGAQAD